jgi:hypothetical protein
MIWMSLLGPRETHTPVPVQIVQGNTDAVAEQNIFTFPTQDVPRHVGHAALTFVILTLEYALMLAAMTFNVGIFFAVITGLAFGTFLFRHIGTRAIERMQVLLPSPSAGICVSLCMFSLELHHAHGLIQVSCSWCACAVLHWVRTLTSLMLCAGSLFAVYSLSTYFAGRRLRIW